METTTDFSFCEGVYHPVNTAIRNREKGDSRWGINDTQVDYYGKFDTEGLPSIYATKLLDHLAHNLGSGVIMDVAGGSNGRAAQNILERDLASRALVTNLEDLRSEESRSIEKLGHVAGDIIKKDTWRRIEEWKEIFAPQGFSAIMYRPYGALENLPLSFYVGGLSTLLDWLGEGGVGLFQIPHFADRSTCPMIRMRDDIQSVFREQGDDTALIYKK